MTTAIAAPENRASGSLLSPAVIGAALLLAAAGLVIGGVVSAVGQFIYLVIVFPVLMGTAGGKLVERRIEAGRWTKKYLAIALGVVMGIAIYTSYHYGSYLFFRAEAAKVVAGKLVEAYGPGADAYTHEALAQWLVDETGFSGFIGYILLIAREGVSIGPLSSSSLTNIGPFFTWLYWLVECGAIVALCIIPGVKMSQRPFCAFHERWYEKPRRLGGDNNPSVPALLDAAKRQDYGAVGRLLEQGTTAPSVEVLAEACKDCTMSNVYLSFEAFYMGANKKLQSMVVLRGVLSPGQFADLQRELQTQRTPGAP